MNNITQDMTQNKESWTYVVVQCNLNKTEIKDFLKNFKNAITSFIISSDYQVHYTFRKDENETNEYNTNMFYISVRIMFDDGLDDFMHRFDAKYYIEEGFKQSYNQEDFVVNPDNDHEWFKYVCFSPSEKWNEGSLNILNALSKTALDYLHLDMNTRIELVHLFCNMMGLEEDVLYKYSKKLKKDILGPSYYDVMLNKPSQGIYYHWDGKYEREAIKYVSKFLDPNL